MILETERNFFLNRLKVNITFPDALAEHRTTKKQLVNAITHLLAQADDKYKTAIKEKAKGEPIPEPAKA